MHCRRRPNSPRRSRHTGAAAVPGAVALLIIFTSALFNLVTAHFGQTVLFRLPAAIPLLGGPYTLEALVFGIINGLVLAGFLGAFTVLTMALPTHALIRLIPRAFYPVAVVISIAVAFVPATLSQFQQIREAQLVRGHRVRGLRDWLPLFMPLLVGGMERAFQLAEAMTARGFGTLGADATAGAGRLQASSAIFSRWLLVLGLSALLTGLLLRLMWGQAVAGMIGIVLGTGLVVAALWLQGRNVKRTVYRTQRWTGRDWAVAAGVMVTFAGYVLLPRISSVSLGVFPLSKAHFPPFLPRHRTSYPGTRRACICFMASPAQKTKQTARLIELQVAGCRWQRTCNLPLATCNLLINAPMPAPPAGRPASD